MHADNIFVNYIITYNLFDTKSTKTESFLLLRRSLRSARRGIHFWYRNWQVSNGLHQSLQGGWNVWEPSPTETDVPEKNNRTFPDSISTLHLAKKLLIFALKLFVSNRFYHFLNDQKKFRPKDGLHIVFKNTHDMSLIYDQS